MRSVFLMCFSYFCQSFFAFLRLSMYVNLRVISFFHYILHFCFLSCYIYYRVIRLSILFLFSNLHWTLSLRSGEYMRCYTVLLFYSVSIYSFMASSSNSCLLISLSVILLFYLSLAFVRYHFGIITIGIAALFFYSFYSFLCFFILFLFSFFLFLFYFFNFFQFLSILSILRFFNFFHFFHHYSVINYSYFN